MSELRWILLFVGALVIGVIYFLGRRSAKARDEIGDIGRLEPQFGDSQRAALLDVPEARRAEDQSRGHDSSSGQAAATRVKQTGVASSAASSSLPGHEWVADEKHPGGAADEQRIFALRLTSRDPQGFAGAEVYKLLQDEDLRYGKFEIFHRLYKDNEDDVVFSVASLTEPGSFDLDTLATRRLRGLSFFMVVPGPQDGGAAFADMLATARRMAERLQGELQDQTGSTLSAQRAATLREEVIQYQYQAGLSHLSQNH